MTATAVMQPTSNEVKREGWDDVRRSGRAAHQQRTILSALAEHGSCTRQEIAERTGLAITSVCGRCKELLDAGRLDVVGTHGKPARQLLDLTNEGVDALEAGPREVRQ